MFANGSISSKEDESTFRLPIRIEGLEKTGTYSGKVYLNIDENYKGIDVEVNIVESIWWAVLAICLGLLISMGVLFYSQRWRYIRSLTNRVNRLLKKYEAAR